MNFNFILKNYYNKIERKNMYIHTTLKGQYLVLAYGLTLELDADITYLFLHDLYVLVYYIFENSSMTHLLLFNFI
jgi:hypothetical protein